MFVRRVVGAFSLTAMLRACADSPAQPMFTYQPPAAQAYAAPPDSQLTRVPLTASGGGTLMVKVGIAGVCCFPFLLDTGASDVSVSPGLFLAMVEGRLVTYEDLIDVKQYRTASGQIVEGLRFRMPPMTVGNKTVHNVVGSVSKTTSDYGMLLGMSFLRKFPAWAIDNSTHHLLLG